ncbi:tRNA N(3)-methylcytidine methyltransferase METTL6-like [Dysidea avara]|uniref:tRNA N(3)-methylcytidine methyltransferase METTL6-like n=1 Tax=Dysidea avara TaxID=196820 RepID=UPI003325F3EB
MATGGSTSRDECSRILTPEEVDRLHRDIQLVSDFKRNKLEAEAKRNWDLFYKRNQTNFFKDRHWITREFPELLQDTETRHLLEAGCGVGNTVFPLLEETTLFIYACDFSPRAVDFVKSHKLYDETRMRVFQCDLTQDDLSDHIPADTLDIVLLFFVLSAISPDKMTSVVTNIYKVLRPGGLVLVRDYGLYDHAMLRFAPGHKISENFYVRQDGTRAYYFSEDKLAELFTVAGYQVIENKYIHKETTNIKEGLCVPRIFIQGKYSKSITLHVNQQNQ